MVSNESTVMSNMHRIPAARGCGNGTGVKTRVSANGIYDC